MMSKMQFICEAMKIGENIKKVDNMLKSDEYKLLSTFTEAENRKALMKKVTKGYTDMLLYKVINSSIFESIKLDEMQTKDAKDVIENLLNGVCEWFSIDMAIKKLEELGIEFLDERD